MMSRSTPTSAIIRSRVSSPAPESVPSTRTTSYSLWSTGGSRGYSRGVTVSGFAEIFKSLGAKAAYNLDGGGSSTMYFNNAVVNNPLGKGRERGTSDILYIA